MFFSIRYLFFVILLTIPGSLIAQDITGTWEGDLKGYEFLQVNIIQVDKIACGYSWDYLYSDRRDYCMANFNGNFDNKRKEWLLSGNSFIQNNGRHTLMKMRLYHTIINGKEMLEGWVDGTSVGVLLLAKLYPPNVRLEKVSASPAQVTNKMKDCNDAKLNEDTITVLRPNGSTIQKIPLPQNWDPEIKSPERPVLLKDSLTLVKQMEGRKNTESSHLIVNAKIIKLDLYDNAIVDGDTISLFYNGKLILSHQPLKEKALSLSITLDENTTRHEITLFAENLGSIPPNTALVIVNAGNKRYELFASASLTENAVIVFDYKPK